MVGMFSVVYPAAALITLLNNVVEMRMDCFKMVEQYRRLVPKTLDGTGTWEDVYKFTTRLQVFVSLLLVFACRNPNLSELNQSFKDSLDGKRKMEEDQGSWQAILVFMLFMEKVVHILRGFLKNLIPPVNPKLRIELKEREALINSVRAQKMAKDREECLGPIDGIPSP